MAFHVLPLEASKFEHLFGKSDQELAAEGAIAYVANNKPGFPCRISLRDAEPGERLILVNYEHLPVDNPYRSKHAIFVLDGGKSASLQTDEVPDYLLCRQLAVRAFDGHDMMLDAKVIDGEEAANCFHDLLADPDASYLHVHNASRGCYMARIERG